MSGGWYESRNVCILLSLLLVGFFATSVNDYSTPLLSEVVSEDEVEFRPASVNCTSERISLWDMQEMILRDVEEKGISTLDHRGYRHLDMESQLDITRLARLDKYRNITRLDGVVILCDSAVCRIRALTFGEQFVWGNRVFSSLLELPLDITRPPRLVPVGSVLSASPQRIDPIFLLLSRDILDDAGRVHPTCKCHNITCLDGSLIHGDNGVCRTRALEFGEQFVWLNRMFLSLFILGFSSGYYLTIYHLLHFVCNV